MKFHYWRFDKGFKFQSYNVIYVVLMMVYNINNIDIVIGMNNIAIANINGVDYRYLIYGCSTYEAISLKENSVFDEKEHLHIFFSIILKKCQFNYSNSLKKIFWFGIL